MNNKLKCFIYCAIAIILLQIEVYGTGQLPVVLQFSLCWISIFCMYEAIQCIDELRRNERRGLAKDVSE